MALARPLDCAWQLRALMSPGPLNEMLSLYAGAEGSRNCLVICTRITLFSSGKGPDRSRLCHSEQVAVAFIYQEGEWWWGNEQ